MIDNIKYRLLILLDVKTNFMFGMSYYLIYFKYVSIQKSRKEKNSKKIPEPLVGLELFDNIFILWENMQKAGPVVPSLSSPLPSPLGPY